VKPRNSSRQFNGKCRSACICLQSFGGLRRVVHVSRRPGRRIHQIPLVVFLLFIGASRPGRRIHPLPWVVLLLFVGASVGRAERSTHSPWVVFLSFIGASVGRAEESTHSVGGLSVIHWCCCRPSRRIHPLPCGVFAVVRREL